ncbi:MAG: hypothetical protein K8H74_18105 [Notoacmeibacter sp.]|nr:hypothetical protein [Notoacmeibacter sp.]
MALACHFVARAGKLAAMSRGIAAIFAIAAFVAGFASVAPGHARDRDARILASELRVALGDVNRLANKDLPADHRTGLNERLAGALGLLPWLLKQAGDEEGAQALAAWQQRSLERRAEAMAFATLLSELAERHKLDLARHEASPVSAAAMREARLIHQTYCAGCHDGAGDGIPDLTLPPRDLFLMARAERSDIFLARLVNGIKGDETIGFHNPLDDGQLTALWKLYRSE